MMSKSLKISLCVVIAAFLFINLLCGIFVWDWFGPIFPDEKETTNTTVAVASLFGDDVMELSIDADNYENNAYLSGSIDLDIAPTELASLISDCSQDDYTYTCYEYSLSGSQDLLVTKNMDNGKTDCYLFRYDGEQYYYNRMPALFSNDMRILFPFHLVPSELMDEYYLTTGAEYTANATADDFYEFYQLSGRYEITRTDTGFTLDGYTDDVDFEVDPRISHFLDSTFAPFRPAGERLLTAENYSVPEVDWPVTFTFREDAGTVFFTVE